MKYFPNNKLNHYITKLHHEFDLDRQTSWECSLQEIQFTRSWYTIDKSESAITITCKACILVPSSVSRQERATATTAATTAKAVAYGPHGIIIEDPPPPPSRVLESEEHDRDLTVRIPGGYYKDIQELINEYNKEITKEFDDDLKIRFLKYKDESSPPKMRYNENNKRVIINVAPGFELTMGPKLQSILGFTDAQLPIVNKGGEQQRGVRGQIAADIHAGIASLFVYSDIIEPVAVGDTVASLLRCVDASGSHGSTVFRYYDRPHYLPLNKLNFSQVEVYISDAFGKLISFQGGSVSITLHIRRAKNNYFI